MGHQVALVPTMGAFHEGHFSLIDAARRRAGCIVVSIFVNPLQFPAGEDYESYPRDLEADAELCRKQGASLLFTPTAEEMYPPGFSTYVEVGRLSEKLCGPFRPGHFRGVATVVLTLFNIVSPDFAVFGEKDYQQLVIIRRMVEDLHAKVDVVSVPTVREKDGLAASSRNRYLSPEERQNALALYKSLQAAREAVASGERYAAALKAIMMDVLQSTPGVKVEYAAVVDPSTLEDVDELRGPTLAAVAARVGKARLIDNLMLRP